jgi:hypothetical protein
VDPYDAEWDLLDNLCYQGHQETDLDAFELDELFGGVPMTQANAAALPALAPPGLHHYMPNSAGPSGE